jgi:hypothetical protein
MMFVLIGVLFLSFSYVFAETIITKSGKTIEGKLIEKTDKYIKIDFQGVPITYFLDEIESIDGVKQSSSLIDLTPANGVVEKISLHSGESSRVKLLSKQRNILRLK